MKKLMEYGYQNTVGKVFFDANEKITEIPVWYGVKPTVNATVAKPFAVTVDKKDGLKNIRILARYDEPIAAPVRVGDVVGELIAEQNGRVIARAPMIAQNKVRKTILFGRLFKNIKVLLGF